MRNVIGYAITPAGIIKLPNINNLVARTFEITSEVTNTDTKVIKVLGILTDSIQIFPLKV